MPDTVLAIGDPEVNKTAHGADPFHGSGYSSPAVVLKCYHAEKPAHKDSDCQAPLSDMVCHEVQDVCALRRVRLCVTPWTVACQASCIQGIFPGKNLLEEFAISFSRGSSPTQRSNSTSLVSPELAGGFFTTESPRGPSGPGETQELHFQRHPGTSRDRRTSNRNVRNRVYSSIRTLRTS